MKLAPMSLVEGRKRALGIVTRRLHLGHVGAIVGKDHRGAATLIGPQFSTVSPHMSTLSQAVVAEPPDDAPGRLRSSSPPTQITEMKILLSARFAYYRQEPPRGRLDPAY